MLLAWLRPDASYPILQDGWTRHAYQPRHGRPPLIVRIGEAAATVLGAARDRYLEPVGYVGDDEGIGGARPVVARRTVGQPVR
jgi:hypothetical protein